MEILEILVGIHERRLVEILTGIRRHRLVEALKSIGWHPVHSSENSVRIFKQSEYADLIGVCNIERYYSEGVFYEGQFAIRGPNGEYIVKYKKSGISSVPEALLWLIRWCAGTGEAYLSNETNIKEIRDVFRKYRKPETKKSLGRELNPQPTHYKCVALPLSHRGIREK